MEAIAVAMPTLAVSLVFCIWNAYRRHSVLKRRQLHERVAYMLWVTALGTE